MEGRKLNDGAGGSKIGLIIQVLWTWASRGQSLPGQGAELQQRGRKPVWTGLYVTRHGEYPSRMEQSDISFKQDQIIPLCLSPQRDLCLME